jgi:DNA-3-methyladenine glycosylase
LIKTDLSFLNGSAIEVAPQLLGCILERQVGKNILRVRIVEAEAYDQNDVASHSYRGQTPRTEVMFGSPGHLYVYFTYGMHYCCNIVVGPKGYGSAVLLRAVEPLTGEETMSIKRNGHIGVELTNGPAKLCQALGIDRHLNGHDLAKSPLQLYAEPALPSEKIVQSRRIGIARGKDALWRFYIKDNIYVSKI